MIVLGLGSNVGDRLLNLRRAYRALSALPNMTIHQVSPLYQSDALLPENAPEDWNHPYLNFAIRATTTLTPEDLLAELKKIEWSIGRKPEVRHWGPRILDIDILVFDDLIIRTDALTVPHENLFNRPFALWPLADVYPNWICPLQQFHGETAETLVKPWGSRFDGRAPFHTLQIPQRIDTAALVGIINITPDSFSDGGEFLKIDAALNHAEHLVKQGAEVLDIGAESTAPNAQIISADEEKQRLTVVLPALMEAIKKFSLPPRVSLDTHHETTAAWALNLGIDWINDQSGLSDPDLVALLANTQHNVVIMHQLGLPAGQHPGFSPTEDVVAQVDAWLFNQLNTLEKQGISRDRIIFDPGIGFGKSPAQSLTLLKNIALFKKHHVRILIGHSRKSFLAPLSPASAKERDLETAALASFLNQQGVDFLRVHNVDLCARLLRITAALAP